MLVKKFAAFGVRTILLLIVCAPALAAPSFTFSDRIDVLTSRFVPSRAVTVTGLDGPTAISVSANDNSQYRINSNPYTNDSGVLDNGDRLTIRHQSADTGTSPVTSTVTVGTYQTTFTTATSADDLTPDPFSFGTKAFVAGGQVVESEEITLSGYTAPVQINISQNDTSQSVEYSTNGGADWSNGSGVLEVDQPIRVRHLADPDDLEYTITRVKIGRVTGYFKTRTNGPLGPDALDDNYTLDLDLDPETADVLTVIAEAGVLVNDPTSDPIKATLIKDPANGSVALADDGGFVYTPAGGFFGADEFTYRADSADGMQQGSTAVVTITVNRPPDVMTRYEMANLCWALKANGNSNFVTRNADGTFSASATDAQSAEPFFLKPSALGHYLMYLQQRAAAPTQQNPGENAQIEYGDVLSVPVAAPGNVARETALSLAGDGSEWTISGVDDSTEYANTPLYDLEPMLNEDSVVVNGIETFQPNEPGSPVWNLDEYRDFVESNGLYSEFTIRARNASGQPTSLAVDANGLLTTVITDSNAALESFSFEPLPRSDCNLFPEAQSDLALEDLHPQGLPTSFSGTNPVTGGVLGHADIHVHISSSTFLGGAQYGATHGRFGITHVMNSCSAEDEHGQNGTGDPVGGLFSGQTTHATTGYPYFNDWPSRDFLTHEAIYWKWIERAWQAGSRLIVNEVVDNETLCELTASQSEDNNADCNSQRNAKDQIGTMYSMMDYIDAQYGGRGEGFFRIVETPEQARAVIEDGKLAIVLGQEISNTIDCKVIYNTPTRQWEPYEETGGLEQGGVRYTCDNESITADLDRLWKLGIRKIISIHEFDNAFGGNGIFNSFLNVGNRENSGGQPASDPIQGNPFANNPPNENPSGEFWTTYDCPLETADNPSVADAQGFDGSVFSGYLWGNRGGEPELDAPEGAPLSPPGCQFTGQGSRSDSTSARPGGAVPCYPEAVDKLPGQCNARWMTPIGVHFYAELMRNGFVFDFDHMEMAMKTQALELTEAQPISYPIVSSHGTFGGTTQNQAMRVLKNGGVMYPSISSSRGFRIDMTETRGIYNVARSELLNEGVPENELPLFGFGYGTDTNGLSAQSRPRELRKDANDNDVPTPELIPENLRVEYPFTLFTGGIWDTMPEFANARGTTFDRPGNIDPLGNGRNSNSDIRTVPGQDDSARMWHEDYDGNAHYGMFSGVVQEIALEATPEEVRNLFNSAEAYIRAWEKTNASRDSIQSDLGGEVAIPPELLRPAPLPSTRGRCTEEDAQAGNPNCLDPS